MGHTLVSETSAAAFPLIRFRDLARVPEKRARVPRVPGVAHPCPGLFDHTDWKSKKGLHVLSYPVFTENIGIVKSKNKVYTSSNVLLSTESIGEKENKVFIVCDEAPNFLRGPRFQPAWPICKRTN